MSDSGVDILNHCYYATVRPWDCLCGICMKKKPCCKCGKPSDVPLTDDSERLGYSPYCFSCAEQYLEGLTRGVTKES